MMDPAVMYAEKGMDGNRMTGFAPMEKEGKWDENGSHRNGCLL